MCSLGPLIPFFNKLTRSRVCLFHFQNTLYLRSSRSRRRTRLFGSVDCTPQLIRRWRNRGALWCAEWRFRKVFVMAECAASASCIKLHLRRAGIRERGVLNQKFYFRKYFRQYSGVFNFTKLKFQERNAYTLRLKASQSRQTTSFSCPCLWSLANIDGAAASEWVPVVDQVLLMASMLLTYMAGVTPVEKPGFTPTKIISGNDMILGSSTFSGSCDSDVLTCAWDVMKQKLLDSLEVAEETTVLGDEVLEFAKRPLSLNAVGEGPRLRLLLNVLMHLEKEVRGIPGNLESTSSDDWKTISSRIIQNSLQPVCMAWLEKELLRENSASNEELVSLIVNKGDLYADLFCFLRHGSLSEGCHYDNALFVSQGTSVLEDLVIALADGIASIYLEFISVDGNASDEMNNVASSLCSLSTRSLQRLRNEVALNQWLHQNMEAVVSMYEDRFDLCTLQTHFIEEPTKSSTKICWWEKVFTKKSGAVPVSLQYVVISNFSMAVKRTKELRALSGWRYYFSLFLELSDITMPLIRTVIDKVSSAISFFLVCLIGRSLGLIYTGIRQSLRWK